MPYRPAQASIKKTPSIERFLGSFHGHFVYGADSTTANCPSTRAPGTENAGPSASNVRQASSSRSTGLPAKRDVGKESTAATTASLFVIKKVPLPKFPIRVFTGEPPPFSLELQKRKIRWRYDWFQDVTLYCIQDPDIHRIQETARPYVKSIAPKAATITVDLLARGSFNHAYNITAENLAIGFRQEYIFRTSLPVWPYYKVESDVATTEFVRHTTSIPVPTIYVFDSNPNNSLGFEWMLMEKVQGTPLHDVWDTMKFDAKHALTRKVASWMAELSRFEFSKIGSIFMRSRQHQLEFYIGPTIHERLFEHDRISHQIYRGPFQSVQALYDAILELAERHYNDPRHTARHALEDSMTRESDMDAQPSTRDLTRHHLRADTEEAILAQADAEDQENERLYGVSKRTLSSLPECLRNYRALLSQLCALLPASDSLVTMLTHSDLSQSNILVDSAGVPIALIDWERARLEPIGLVDIMPRFLAENGEEDAFYAPPGSTVTKQERSAGVYDYDYLARIRGMNESNYETIMGKIQRTGLRAVYREELRRLRSPMCEGLNRDPQGFERQLMHRVYWPEDPENTEATFWAVKYLGDAILDDSDDEQESDD